MLDIEYEFREEDLVHFNELRLKSDPEMQKKIRQNRIFAPGVMMAIALFYYVYYVDMKTTAYITVLALAWAIASPFIMKIDMRRQFFNKYTEAEKKALFGMHHLTIEPEFLQERAPGGKSKTPWKDMLRVEKHKDYVYIYVDIDAAIVIPRATVKKGDLKAFAKQVEGMIDRAG
ncbi:YcxB family protein [Methylomonas sp. SURF-1]|uniref:YcxB family protein n=1 Tax=Methylomonas aurea TaxID=2952224 RepID=A0ABT1UCP3_9GAMM|nr:YcxB family protein [Methylomonas sp. SURF-1]MCQ8179495.1 YcxB family protein [Methylomonas sp. SURF-1]